MQHRIQPWYGRWYVLLILIVAFYLLLMGSRVFFYETYRMPSGSMLPNFPVGSYVLVNKWGYGNYRFFGKTILRTGLSKKVHRGDVLIVKFPGHEKYVYIKRVIGLPGDKIEYQDKVLSINGTKASYETLRQGKNFTIKREKLPDASELIRLSNNYMLKGRDYIVPQNAYFVLGDNRDNSRDSRSWGFVRESDLIGKVVYVFK